MTAADSDMKKVGNSFLQLKLVLNKGGRTEDVFMGTLKREREGWSWQFS